MREYLKRLVYVLVDSKKKLLLLVALAIFSSSLEAIGIGMVGPFIALATNPNFIAQNPQLMASLGRFGLAPQSNPTQMLTVLGVVVIGIFYLKTFLGFYVQKYIFQFGYAQRAALFSRLMYAYSRAPYTYHLSHNSAELIQNMVNETDLFSNQALMPFLFVCSNGLVVLAIVLLLLLTNAIAVFVVFGIFLVSALLFQSFKHRISFWGKERGESFESSIRIINHAIGGLKEVRVIGCETYFEQQASHQIGRYASSGAAFIAFSNLPRFAIEAFLVTFLVGFTFIYLSFDKQGSGSLSSVLGIFAMASIRMLPAVSLLIGAIGGLRYAGTCLDKMYFTLKELEKIVPYQIQHWAADGRLVGEVITPAMQFADRIALEKIVYRYPNSSEPSLKGVSLTLKKGQSIGLIGRSGAGKTTLVDLVLGLLTPESGDLSVDGVSVYHNLRAWQNLIGYVPQSIFLIDDTLARNIAFGVPDHLIDYKQLHKAIAVAQLEDLVERLPGGLDSMIGERGTRLSGGQRQRVGIARVIYHDRQILILDEATAALDNETESLVSEAVKSLGGTKTLIIIAHRLSTIEHCDRIYMMERGQVVKSGTYDEVVLNLPTASISGVD
jgi:ATP-binding cassette, subfamily B, bacterial PglK